MSAPKVDGRRSPRSNGGALSIGSAMSRVVPANPNRLTLTIHNDSAETIYIAYSERPTSEALPLVPGATLFEEHYVGDVWAASSGTNGLTVPYIEVYF